MPALPFAGVWSPVHRVFRRLTVIVPKEAKVTIGLDVGSIGVKAVALGASRKSGGKVRDLSPRLRR